MRGVQYLIPRGIRVSRFTTSLPFAKGLDRFRRDLHRHRGIYLSSGYEYPGRYSRWDIAAVAPPLEIIARDRDVEFRALNSRGAALLQILDPVLAPHPHWESFEGKDDHLHGVLKPLAGLFHEEQR